MVNFKTDLMTAKTVTTDTDTKCYHPVVSTRFPEPLISWLKGQTGESSAVILRRALYNEVKRVGEGDRGT